MITANFLLLQIIIGTQVRPFQAPDRNPIENLRRELKKRVHRQMI